MQQNFFECAVFVEFPEYPKALQIASRALLALLHRAEMFIDELFSQLLVIRLAFRRFQVRLNRLSRAPRLVGLSSANVAAAKNGTAITSKEILISILTCEPNVSRNPSLFKRSTPWSSAPSPDNLYCTPHEEVEPAA